MKKFFYVLTAFCLFSISCSSNNNEACALDPSYNPAIDPTDFSTPVDNPLWPLTPGTEWVYAEGEDTDTITVTANTKVILGVTTIEVHDILTDPDNETIEDTLDWYAADNEGNVWYFGEATTEYENGLPVSTEGSWEAGVDGALPGIVMFSAANRATQGLNNPYRQEYYPCEALDQAELVSLAETVTVPYDNGNGTTYTNCLQTREFTDLDPTLNEYKYYCDGIGFIAQDDVGTGDRQVELVSFTPGT